mmetsp:Transcript_68/g.140  ORF Transcript_68/g.140 Transcript_68/m.140 type:complete len:172 (-) Transcript_68:110-625(-)
MSDITKNVVISYGAMEEGKNNELGSLGMTSSTSAYDIDKLRFVPNDNLTPQEKRSKCITVTFCLSVFALIIGGIAYMLFSDFGHLYPGSGAHRENYPSVWKKTSDRTPVLSPGKKDNSSTEPPKLSPRPPHFPTKEKESPAACSAYEKCANLGLEHDCCPTTEGTMLGCCY